MGFHNVLANLKRCAHTSLVSMLELPRIDGQPLFWFVCPLWLASRLCKSLPRQTRKHYPPHVSVSKIPRDQGNALCTTRFSCWLLTAKFSGIYVLNPSETPTASASSAMEKRWLGSQQLCLRRLLRPVVATLWQSRESPMARSVFEWIASAKLSRNGKQSVRKSKSDV